MGMVFRNEDEPLYKKALIIPFWHIKSTNTIQIYLKQPFLEESLESLATTNALRKRGHARAFSG
jgi:hypothetical protein